MSSCSFLLFFLCGSEEHTFVCGPLRVMKCQTLLPPWIRNKSGNDARRAWETFSLVGFKRQLESGSLRSLWEIESVRLGGRVRRRCQERHEVCAMGQREEEKEEEQKIFLLFIRNSLPRSGELGWQTKKKWGQNRILSHSVWILQHVENIKTILILSRQKNLNNLV